MFRIEDYVLATTHSVIVFECYSLNSIVLRFLYRINDMLKLHYIVVVLPHTPSDLL